METNNSNVIIKCLGKALKTPIKFIFTADIKFYSLLNKIIFGENKTTSLICLGKKFIFFLREDMKQIYEVISYENIKSIESDKKSIYILHLIIKSSDNMNYKKTTKISISSKNIKSFKNNLMCYYTVYNEYYYSNIKEIKFFDKYEKDEVIKEDVKINSKFHKEILQNYIFYLKGQIKKGINANGYHITYIKEVNKKNQKKDEKKIKEEEDEEEEKNYFSKECELDLDFSEPSPISSFDKDEDKKDLSFYAFKFVYNYLKFHDKISKFWILKNELFTKKINLNEDISLWEGWRIDVRTYEPSYYNKIFIFLRRKYIPPYYDTYQNFCFILTENSSKDNYEINPESNKVICLAANSLYTPLTSKLKDNKLFLQAKVDALLVDEETLYFYQNCYGIYGEDIYTFGYEFLSTIINYFEKTNVKEAVEPLRQIINTKRAKWDLHCEDWKFKTRNYEFMKKIKEYIFKVANVKKSNNQDELIDEEEDNYSYNLIDETPEETPLSNDNNTIKNKKNGYTPTAGFKNKSSKTENFIKIWANKVMRFIGFVLDGGLTDYKINYNEFLKKILDQCQFTNNDISDLCYSTINLKEIGTSLNKNTLFSPKSILASLDVDSNLSYNQNPLLNCISSNFLQKYLESIGYKFISNFMVKNKTNELLKAIYEDLKFCDDPNNVSEKRGIINLIPPLREIFENNKEYPSTLLLACKSLCLLVKKESDKVHRIKLIYEGNILKTIGDYLEEYDYDQTLILCCLDLFSYIFVEAREKLKEILYSKQGNGLMDKFFKFLQRPLAPGVYYSQRIMIKIISILLNLTTSIEADVREKFKEIEYQKIYSLLINLIKEEEKVNIIDPLEEESSILEFKIYYLLMVLTSKNDHAQNLLFSLYNFMDIIENNSEKYLKELKTLISLKKQASEVENKTIGKKIYKFLEIVYYLIIGNYERQKEVYEKCSNFMKLREYCEDTLYSILSENDTKSDVINMLKKVFLKLKEEM